MEAVDGAMRSTDAIDLDFLRNEVERFIYSESRLLDERRYVEWLDLFAEGSIYWLPIGEGNDEDPEEEISIIYDDDERRAERVFRTLHTLVLDQNPPSRTLHVAGNLEVEYSFDGIITLTNQIIMEMRPGPPGTFGTSTPRIFGAKVSYDLSRDELVLKIRKKKVVSIDSDRAHFDLSFPFWPELLRAS